MPINDSSALKFPTGLGDEPEGRPLGKFVSIELPDDAVANLNELMLRTGDTSESLIRRALGLYKIAHDVKLDDCKLAIVDAETNEFVQDIAGL